MEKKKKVFLIVLATIALSFIMFICVAPKVYLACKYDTKITEYKMKSFTPGFFIYDLNFWSIVWHEPYWKFECQGRTFFVVFTEGELLDDYQLEDVEKMLVEELQENINEHICYVQLSSYHIFGLYNDFDSTFNYYFNNYKNVVWTKENVGEIMKEIEHPDVYFYYEDPSSSEELSIELTNDLKKMDERYDRFGNFILSNIYVCSSEINLTRGFNDSYVGSSPCCLLTGLDEDEVKQIEKIHKNIK
ncbi:MAG: hypothetical protein IJ851_05370 [Eubacterium sp.]|nr:hypothetical protein [Eubacterium sp.]